jgi:hypothetical protein
MNESELEAFESRLRNLRPADVSPELRRAIETELDAADASPRVASGKWIRVSLVASWTVTGIAAAFAVALLLREPRTVPDAAPAETEQAPETRTRLVPVSGAGVLCAAHDEGLVVLDDGAPALRVRYQFLDTIEMRTPGGEARMNLSYPREEIRVVPIHMY